MPTQPVRFASEEWEQTIKQQTFFYPPAGEARPSSPSKGAATKKGKTVRGRKQSRSEGKAARTQTTAVSSDAEDEESEVPVSKTKSAPGPTLDGDAMDIDSETPHPASHSASPNMRREPRLVTVPPQRPDWREPSNPNAVPPPPGHIPSAVPNAAVPPPPPPPPPPSSNTKQKRDTTLNLDALRTAAPFTPSGTGLHSLAADLTGTLPFESQPSTSGTLHALSPRDLKLPPVPRAPNAPMEKRITQTQWREYMSAIAFYMGQWYQFDEKMLTHFRARHISAERFGTGGAAVGADVMKALEALGEGSGEEGEGLLSYLRGMDEDVKVQKHWDVAREKHRIAVEVLVDVKSRIWSGERVIVADV